MFAKDLETFELKQSARTATTDFEPKGSVSVSVGVRSIMKIKFLRARMDSLSVLTLNSFQGQY